MLASVFSAVFFVLTGYFEAAYAGSVLNSNAIKSIAVVANPSHPVSASPDELMFDSGSQNLAMDTIQPLSCTIDEECDDQEFCYASRGICVLCKRRRKRCIRDAMCCPGNHCSNGVCLSNDSDMVQHAGVEEVGQISSALEDNSTLEMHIKEVPQVLPQTFKGLEGENCLRSNDCSEGLCCARHFWSKICKPVLKEGQVCTKHRRKGNHGLEIFQRCDCAEGLSCRTQKGDHIIKSPRSLHTCQRH